MLYVVMKKEVVAKCTMKTTICDSTWEKGPSCAFFQNRVIATVGKSWI